MVFRQKHIFLLIGVLIIIVAIDLWGIALLYRHNALVRLVSVADLAAVHPKASLQSRDMLLERFEGDDPVEIMQKVMNAVKRTELFDSYDLADIFDHIDHDGGLGCTGMAALYSAALNANGFESRRVVLLRNMYGVYDAHTIVEVYENQRWVVYDPTFNISFMKNGQKIGALEISNTLYDGSADEMTVVYYGNVAYPARLETYYMNWQPLYNNVFVLDQADSGVFGKIPPFRYWSGPIYFLQPFYTGEGVLLHWYQFHQQVYLAVVVILPVLTVMITLLLCVICFISLRRQRQSAASGK